MPAECPMCRSEFTKVIESRALKNGTRRRRSECRSCDYRWTDHDGKPLPDSGRVIQPKKPALTADVVRLILTSPLSSTQLAKVIDRSKETVAAVRRGDMHRNTCPELPRWGSNRRRYDPDGLRCESCYQWRGVCGLEIPESELEGVLFAQDCAVFSEAM